MRQSGGLALAAGLDGGNTLIDSNPSSSAKTKQLIRKDGLFCFMWAGDSNDPKYNGRFVNRPYSGD